MAHYSCFRDLVITAKRGGYLVRKPKPDVIIFEDTPVWNGINDFKNIYISEFIEKTRSLKQGQFNPKEPSRNDTYAYEDFPHEIETSRFKSSEFWVVFNYLFRISGREILISSKPKKQGRALRTSHTRELTLIRMKDSLTREISKNTDLTGQTVESILSWITFNVATDRKFSLFHCPLIELNRSVYLILPHSFILGYPPTLFLRLLAHFDKSSYDAISTQMEKRKLSEIASHLHSQKTLEKKNFFIEFKGEKNEIDLIQYDKVENILNIAQAKMIIRPDSVAEVDNANQSISKGVEQLQFNKKLLEAGGIKALLKKLGFPDNMSEPNINYFLMPTSFTGSDFLNIPDWINVIPIDYCCLPSEKAKTLNQVCYDYKVLWSSLDKKAETSKTSEEFELAGFKVRYPGFLM